MNFQTWFSQKHSSIPFKSAEAVLKLASEGATIPFMARYRKEQTGNLDEVAIQTVLDEAESYENLLKRQAFIIEEIERQKKLTPELKIKILATFVADQLEDLYLPYKQKRKTKAQVAREAGLEELATLLWQWGTGEVALPEESLEVIATRFINPDKDIADVTAALNGAQDILTEKLSEDASLRELVRKTISIKGNLISKKGDEVKPASKFDRYFEYKESITSLMKPESSHRYLALRRGWTEKELTVTIGSGEAEGGYEDTLLKYFENTICKIGKSEAFTPIEKILKMAARLALKVYVMPAIETEIHRELKQVADTAAIQVFAENVRQVLLSSPFGPKGVIGIDPGIRTGCKMVVVDQSGKYIHSTVLHFQTESQIKESAQLLTTLIPAAQIQGIAIGNGTAGRETEVTVRAILKAAKLTVPVVMVNESGASIYSASPIARAEFPDLDLTVRGAISIARRFQDPLAELVKLDPKSIGVGQYQHDVNPAQLKKGLDLVVERCVNSVGVNVNTASVHLLAHVSGIGPKLAESIVEHRSKKGLFKSRSELKEVSRFSDKIFEQAAGFLRVAGGDQPLDNTGVHPERYPLLEKLAEEMDKKVADLLGAGVSLIKKSDSFKKLVGEFTFADIIAELEKPGRDPRETFEAFSFREDIHDLTDLKEGLTCPGIVTNVTNFGAFVDIGVHQDGLVHISQLSDQFVKDPRDVVKPGDHVHVRVLSIDVEKRQIALTMKSGEKIQKSSPTLSHSKLIQKPKKQEPFNNPFAILRK